MTDTAGSKIGGGAMPKARPLRVLEVTYGCSRSNFEKTPRANYATVHYLNEFGHIAENLDPLLFSPVRLLRQIRRFKPDVIVSRHLAALLLGLYRKLGWLRVPLVHAWDDYYAEQSRFRLMPFWVEKLSVTLADHVVSVSPYNIQLARTWGKPCTFVPHGTSAVTKDTPLVLKGSGLKMVYLGDQSPYKGTRALVSAMTGVACDLFMVGSPNADLQRLSPPNVHFVGKVPADEVQAVLAQADILVNPADQDSNFKLQEYIRSGKPILGTNGRMAWAFEHGRDAWLVDDLAEGVKRLAADADLRRVLAQGVRARRVLTWEQVVRELESVLVRVAAEKALPA